MRVMLLVPTIGGCTYEYHHPEELRRSSGNVSKRAQGFKYIRFVEG